MDTRIVQHGNYYYVQVRVFWIFWRYERVLFGTINGPEWDVVEFVDQEGAERYIENNLKQ